MSNNNVIELDMITKLDIPVERVIRSAAEADLESVVIIGWEKDGAGGGFYVASSIADGPDVLWLLEIAKKKLLGIGDPPDAA